MKNDNGIIIGNKYRISVLTNSLIRLEYSIDGIFEDRMTQTVTNRTFPIPQYNLIDKDDELEILTDKLHLIYNKKEFSMNGLSIEVLDGIGAVWQYGYVGRNLMGTTRTLDDIDGATKLNTGILSKSGFAILDDSKSIIQTEDGWVEPRENGKIDLYFFGYGYDFPRAIKDFYHLSGKTPMIPRYALGNWWSRYCRYTQDSYEKLMCDFEKKQIPFSVAVIDMDWHLVDIDPKYGDGWTGYTWNKELFPDPKGFMDWLHNRGMKVTLNVHPASGVRAHEDMYIDMAKELGVDYENEVPISFDITNRKFLDAYFKYLHHPNEDMGVDFWWVDWQQGNGSKIDGLDGLWMLNHYHYLDNARNNKRPMTFSRYAGPGSHRYPVGFSGDTYITWESLAFQPYFTATASNIGYGWWSNDIGGHMEGYHNEELSLRWYQFGVFSPIMRLHSSNNLFLVKEPWNFSMEIECNMTKFLQLRHKLVPYLYTMNYNAYFNDTPMLQPMYYYNSDKEVSYEVPNEYYFGSELIAMPITAPMIQKYKKSKVIGWLPKGDFIDIFTNRIYSGNRKMSFYRGLSSIPVFAKSGAILPMLNEEEMMRIDCNPNHFDINVYGGANGEFKIYEDDNSTQNYQNGDCCQTQLVFDWDNSQFSIMPVAGNASFVPQNRSYTLNFICCGNAQPIITVNGKKVECKFEYDDKSNQLKVNISSYPVNSKIEVTFASKLALPKSHITQDIFELLEIAEIQHCVKENIYNLVLENNNPAYLLPQLQSLEIDNELINMLTEIITAY
ncbi:MAG: glycoside hydrolase family 31 protein [Oscillospiraceae bacterium]